MKKILMTGLLAISALALSQQEASAWINSRFGIGLNWDWLSGGNSFLWGAWRNGQPPGPEAYGMPHGAPRHAMTPPYVAPQQQGFSAVPQGVAPAPQGYLPV